MLNLFDRLLLVRGVPIFEELREDFLIRLVPVMEEEIFEAKQPIIRQGEEGSSMFIIASGQVKVHIGDQELKRLGREEFFGEMALFDSESRSASVTALERCVCLELTQQQLYSAIDETPGIALNLIRILSGRIRKLNQEINELRGSSNGANPKAMPREVATRVKRP
ncbi:cyclic nucleotide-binding domain-containing protein [Alkalinema pantanalense CENA528]|uniref:cyclic nucleotide-binding domain-containing protein n=1 Tax=Alkalinema pantanalense TaxID=1620705 RepID=UPI003D6E9AF5